QVSSPWSLMRWQLGLERPQPHRLPAPTPLAGNCFKHTVAARITIGATSVGGQTPCRNVVPVGCLAVRARNIDRADLRAACKTVDRRRTGCGRPQGGANSGPVCPQWVDSWQARSKFRKYVKDGDQARVGQVPTELHSTTTRPPAVAGVFYAAGRDQLQMQVLNLLAGVISAPKVTPKALIAPHAGYVCSGHVAAAAFATLQDNGHAVTRV